MSNAASQKVWRAVSFAAQELSPKNVIGRRIDGHKINMRPLGPVAPYPVEPQAISLDSLKHWVASEQYKKVHEYFENYPENCLTTAFERSFLYHLIRTMKPRHVAEIGTYFAGSTEVMARALWENGSGKVHTADPMGFHRVPRILFRWPRILRSYVKYYPFTSMTFVHLFRKRGFTADIVFIDGNHDYEFVVFDLLSAARMTRPGGIIILDDMDQPGPYWAAVEFLRKYPAWREIGDAIARFNPAAPFAVSEGLMGSKFIVLQSENDLALTDLPYTTGQAAYDGIDVARIRLTVAAERPKGTIHGKVYLRGHRKDLPVEQLASQFSVAVSEKMPAEISLDEVLRTNLSHSFRPQQYNQKVEIILYWQPENPGTPLRLVTPPIPQPS